MHCHGCMYRKTLKFRPVNQTLFEKLMFTAVEAFKKLIMQQELAHVGMPLLTEAAIQEAATEQLQMTEEARLTSMVTFLEGTGINQLPPRADMIGAANAQPLNFVPRLTQADGQSDDSFREQQQALELGVNRIDAMNDPNTAFLRGIQLIGAPGSGKTYVMCNIMAYAICQGKKCAITALTSQRARTVGGEHVHLMFGIPVSSGNVTSSSETFQIAQLNLMKKPVRMVALKRLQVLFIEEIGLFSSELLAVIDRLLRALKENDKPFGGVVLICTGDHRQLTPISGSYVFLSSHFVTSFNVFLLDHSVRAANDIDLQNLIQLLRMPRLHRRDRQEVISILRRRCLNRMVASWDDVDLNTIRVVGKRSAEKLVMNKWIDKMKRTHANRYVESQARDEVSYHRGQWQDAHEDISAVIDKKCQEPRNLVIFQGSVMRLTYNNNNPTANNPAFSQGQLVYLVTLPDLNLGVNDQRIVCRLIPVGANVRTPNDVDDRWPLFHMKRRKVTVSHWSTGYLTARRDQWPMRHNVVSTVHRTLGETCDSIATQLSASDPTFALWEREQLLVMLSRVRSLQNMHFVGAANDTERNIRKLLTAFEPIVEYIDDALNRFNVVGRQNVLIPIPPLPRICSRYSEIPNGSVGFVCLLLSVRDPTKYLIREAECIRTLLRVYNGTLCPDEAYHNKPWTVAAFVCGFVNDGNNRANILQRRQFAGQWVDSITMKELELRQSGDERKATVKEAIAECLQLANYIDDPDIGLVGGNNARFFVQICIEY